MRYFPKDINLLSKRAQSAIVYAALIAMVVGGLLVISMYIKRAVQGRYHQSADVFGAGAQYQPGSTTVTSR